MLGHKISRISPTIPLFFLLGISLLVVLGSLLVQIPEAPKNDSLKPAKGTIGVVKLDSQSADQLLRKQAQLKDPSPLFLPTEWNSAFRVDAERNLRKPGEAFRGYGPNYLFGGSTTPVASSAPVEPPSNSVGELDHLRADRTFSPLGLETNDIKPFAQDKLYIQLLKPGTGEHLTQLQVPIGDWSRPGPWQPAEYLVLASPAGLVGRPSLVLSSGLEGVDSHLEQVIRDNWVNVAHAARLSTGIYRISIGQ